MWQESMKQWFRKRYSIRRRNCAKNDGKTALSTLTFFISRQNELAEQLRAAKLEKERFLKAEEDQTIQQTQELIETLEAGPDFLDAFDGELFRELVDKIIVESNDRLRFRLVNGLELTEPIERTVR